MKSMMSSLLTSAEPPYFNPLLSITSCSFAIHIPHWMHDAELWTLYFLTHFPSFANSSVNSPSNPSEAQP
ncbi:hypothetical protein NLA02_21445, partial [Xanthomonas citri pv. anacardii]|uniref:hypothetical protein n=1 Tax=Xanthomonas citri TaxID=346 RepID=UPI0021C094E2